MYRVTETREKKVVLKELETQAAAVFFLIKRINYIYGFSSYSEDLAKTITTNSAVEKTIYFRNLKDSSGHKKNGVIKWVIEIV